ncbi:MAG: hypothetical protein MUC83_00705 [Pirellula sp.]|jgi:hypothetical protein|nr:hypothetical protein [Pirellula sp.]
MTDVANLAGSKVLTKEGNVLAFLVDIAAILLLILSFAIGWRFWAGWLSQTDSLVCTICLGLGFVIAVARGLFYEPVYHRNITPWVFFSLAFLVLFFAMVAGRPKLTGISAGLAIAGWLSRWLKGDNAAQSLSLGFAFMVPSVVDACKERGAFEFIESAVLTLTSGLSEALSQFHIQRDGIIEFGHGVADRFSSVGRWDSILPFVGISFFCIYLFRRTLIPSLLTVSMAFFVWMAIRSSAWVTFAWYAEQYGAWHEWTMTTEIVLFLMGAVLIVLLDQFFASLLAPIPAEFVNEDLPLIAYLWNWFVLLPSLKFTVPSRAKETFDDELEEE